jgi:hypothetical protein
MDSNQNNKDEGPAMRPRPSFRVPWGKVSERYLNDTTFHQTVDMMRAFLAQYHLTAGELREAAVLAAGMHEMENIKPLIYNKKDGSWMMQEL